MGRNVLLAFAVIYLAGIGLDGSGTGIPAKVLPRALNYFVQVSQLFPYAATASIDYRAEAYVCRERAWKELDTRAYFRIDPEDKENRFSRVMHFFRENRPTMTALDSYFVEHHPKSPSDDGIPREEPIGGVRLSSLRIPIPKPGEEIVRFTRRPLSDYPAKERKNFYHTPLSKLSQRCGFRVEEAE